jgi:hypothetical protein
MAKKVLTSVPLQDVAWRIIFLIWVRRVLRRLGAAWRMAAVGRTESASDPTSEETMPQHGGWLRSGELNPLRQFF